MSNTIRKESGFRVRSISKFLLDTSGFWALLILVMAFYIGNDAFLNRMNLKNLVGNLAPLLIMACGATLVRFVGSLDLSMGSVASCANVILVVLMPVMNAGAYVVALLFGLVAGLLLGLVHAKLKMPSFIASLGFMNIWNSVALLITPSPLRVTKAFEPLINWGKVVYFDVVSLPTVIALVIMLLFLFFQMYTAPGRSLNLIGGNERASRLAGVKIDRYKIMAFAICGLTSALCGIFLAVKLRSCAPTVGSSYTLQAVAAVLLGGTSATGGRGNIYKTLLGVAIVVVIQNGMTIIGVDAFWTQIVFGGLILVSMMLTSDRGSKHTIVK